jgi:hypothetical protein
MRSGCIVRMLILNKDELDQKIWSAKIIGEHACPMGATAPFRFPRPPALLEKRERRLDCRCPRPGAPCQEVADRPHHDRNLSKAVVTHESPRMSALRPLLGGEADSICSV